MTNEGEICNLLSSLFVIPTCALLHLSHNQFWLMRCLGRLKFKWRHFLLKAFYYVCFYTEAATLLVSVCAAFTVIPQLLCLYCLRCDCGCL